MQTALRIAIMATLCFVAILPGAPFEYYGYKPGYRAIYKIYSSAANSAKFEMQWIGPDSILNGISWMTLNGCYMNDSGGSCLNAPTTMLIKDSDSGGIRMRYDSTIWPFDPYWAEKDTSFRVGGIYYGYRKFDSIEWNGVTTTQVIRVIIDGQATYQSNFYKGYGMGEYFTTPISSTSRSFSRYLIYQNSASITKADSRSTHSKRPIGVGKYSADGSIKHSSRLNPKFKKSMR